MTGWMVVGTNALWITGLAMLLASYSYLSYVGTQRDRSARQLARYQQKRGIIVGSGWLLVSLGLSIASTSSLTRVIAGVMASVAAIQLMIIVFHVWRLRKVHRVTSMCGDGHETNGA